MSLQIWLPLNGSTITENISNKTITATASSLPAGTANTGKIGVYGYDFSTKGIRINNLKTFTTMSFALWIKLTDNTKNCHILDFRNPQGEAGYQPMYYNKDTKQIQIYSSGGATASSYIDADLSDKQWHHLCVIIKNNYGELFLDGVSKGSKTGFTMLDNVNTALSIGCRCSNTNPCPGIIQDVRVYDHILSPREVKLLSQGLIAHYKLDVPAINLLNNSWPNTNFANVATGTYSSFSSQLGTNSLIEVRKFDSQNCLYIKGGSGSKNRCFKTLSVTGDTTYTFSVDIYSTNNVTIYCEGNGGDYGSNWPPLGAATYTDTGKWKRMYYTITTESNPTLYFFITAANGQEVYVKNFQLEENNCMTRYIPVNKTDNYIYDCSGYNNHGVQSTAIQPKNNSPRYENCANFENNKYINCGRGPMVTDELTVSVWAYLDDWSEYASANMRIASCTETGGWNFEPGGSGKIRFANYSKIGAYKNAVSSQSLSGSGWHLITGTSDGVYTKIYIDGVLQGATKRSCNIVNSANTLLYTYNNTRNYYKSNNGEAYFTTVYRSGSTSGQYWFQPLLVSKNSDAVAYHTTGDHISGVLSYSGSFTYNDETWYYSSGGAAMPEKQSTGIPCINDGIGVEAYASLEAAARDVVYGKIPVQYNNNNNNAIFIGAEAGTNADNTPAGNYFTGKISDFRIYATALSAAAVKELYQSSISFLDNGTLQCSEIVESPTNLKYNQNGITQAELVSEIGYTNKMKIKTLPDGSAWARVFYHKTNGTSGLFTSYDEIMETTSANKFSRLNMLEHFRGPDSKFEFMLTYPEKHPGQYNRWKQSYTPQVTWMGNADSNAVVVGYESIHIDWSSNFWGGLGRQNEGTTNTYLTFIDGSIGHGNWFYAIGATHDHDGGFPGPTNGVQEVELWVRIDNLPKLTKLSMLDEAIQAYQIYEL